jgi:hypothetical protein
VNRLRGNLWNAAKEAQHLLLVRALLELHIAPARPAVPVPVPNTGRFIAGVAACPGRARGGI